jgi:hypothetical protein
LPRPFALLAERLRNSKRFILSIKAMPAIRETFAGFRMEGIELLHTVSGGKGRTARVVIICWRLLSDPNVAVRSTSVAARNLPFV